MLSRQIPRGYWELFFRDWAEPWAMEPRRREETSQQAAERIAARRENFPALRHALEAVLGPDEVKRLLEQLPDELKDLSVLSAEPRTEEESEWQTAI